MRRDSGAHENEATCTAAKTSNVSISLRLYILESLGMDVNYSMFVVNKRPLSLPRLSVCALSRCTLLSCLWLFANQYFRIRLRLTSYSAINHSQTQLTSDCDSRDAAVVVP